jgi:hypothetical protein
MRAGGKSEYTLCLCLLVYQEIGKGDDVSLSGAPAPPALIYSLSPIKMKSNYPALPLYDMELFMYICI